jgi:hypothetical protein
VSASTTMTTSLWPCSGSRRRSTWLSAPAFLRVLATDSTTSTPAPWAIATVASVQLSATTMIRSGRCDWPTRDAIVARRDASSLCAGIRTVTVTGPSKTSWVRAMTILGANGLVPIFTERRDWLVIRRSSSATPAANRTATPTAATATRGVGASVAYRTVQTPKRNPRVGATPAAGPVASVASSISPAPPPARPRIRRPINRGNHRSSPRRPAGVAASEPTSATTDDAARSAAPPSPSASSKRLAVRSVTSRPSRQSCAPAPADNRSIGSRCGTGEPQRSVRGVNSTAQPASRDRYSLGLIAWIRLNWREKYNGSG